MEGLIALLHAAAERPQNDAAAEEARLQLLGALSEQVTLCHQQEQPRQRALALLRALRTALSSEEPAMRQLFDALALEAVPLLLPLSALGAACAAQALGLIHLAAARLSAREALSLLLEALEELSGRAWEQDSSTHVLLAGALGMLPPLLGSVPRRRLAMLVASLQPILSFARATGRANAAAAAACAALAGSSGGDQAHPAGGAGGGETDCMDEALDAIRDSLQPFVDCAAQLRAQLQAELSGQGPAAAAAAALTDERGDACRQLGSFGLRLLALLTPQWSSAMAALKPALGAAVFDLHALVAWASTAAAAQEPGAQAAACCSGWEALLQLAVVRETEEEEEELEAEQGAAGGGSSSAVAEGPSHPGGTAYCPETLQGAALLVLRHASWQQQHAGTGAASAHPAAPPLHAHSRVSIAARLAGALVEAAQEQNSVLLLEQALQLLLHAGRLGRQHAAGQAQAARDAIGATSAAAETAAAAASPEQQLESHVRALLSAGSSLMVHCPDDGLRSRAHAALLAFLSAMPPGLAVQAVRHLLLGMPQPEIVTVVASWLRQQVAARCAPASPAAAAGPEAPAAAAHAVPAAAAASGSCTRDSTASSAAGSAAALDDALCSPAVVDLLLEKLLGIATTPPQLLAEQADAASALLGLLRFMLLLGKRIQQPAAPRLPPLIAHLQACMPRLRSGVLQPLAASAAASLQSLAPKAAAAGASSDEHAVYAFTAVERLQEVLQLLLDEEGVASRANGSLKVGG